jgi:hypothetical protein
LVSCVSASVRSVSGVWIASKAKRGVAARRQTPFSSSHICDADVTQLPLFNVTISTGMEAQVHETGIMGKQPAISRDKQFIGLDEVSSVVAELRGWVDPFVLASWVGKEAEGLGPLTRFAAAVDERPECDPGVILSVLAYSYSLGVFSSEEIVRNCRTNPALSTLAGGKFLFRQELTRFRRRHRALLTELVARIFIRAVSEWFGLDVGKIAPYLDTHLRRLAIEKLDIARHLDAIDE